MLKSDIVEIDGVFVGAAILQPNRIDRKFFATHERVRSLHGVILPSLSAVRRQAIRHFSLGARSAEPPERRKTADVSA